MPYFRISSLHCLCVAKQAMAHILISTPVWNCFPRMSHTPWLGVATVRFWGNKSNRHSSDWKRSSQRYLQFQDNKRVYYSKSDPRRVKVYRKSLFKMETRGKAKASPVLRTAALGLGARAPSHGPSHPALWTGTLGQMDPHHNLRFSPRRDFSMLQKYLIIIHITNNRLTGTLQKCSYSNFIEKGSDLTAQYYQPIPSENNYYHEIYWMRWFMLPSLLKCSFSVCSFKSVLFPYSKLSVEMRMQEPVLWPQAIVEGHFK